MAKLVVLLVLVAFACAVLADPYRGEPYGLKHGPQWYRYPPGRYYGRPDDSRIIVIIQERPTTSAAVTPAPSSEAPTAAPVSTVAAESSTAAAVTAG